MPNLKDLRNRIDSVKSTQKITSAMKMVAAAKLRRAQESAEAARPYAGRMERMLGSLADSLGGVEGAPRLLAGTGNDQIHLLVAFTANRGLCGGFNGSIVRRVREMAHGLKADGKTVKILCVGRKGHDVLKREFAGDIVASIEDIGKRHVEYHEAVGVSNRIIELFEAGEFDVCTVVFNRFQSAMTQFVTPQQLIPFVPTEEDKADAKQDEGPQPVYIFEPEEEEILENLLPRNLGVQIFQAMLESSASEHGARMTAMDSATRNAGDMIDNLTLTYNRTRQAFITKELIEIISGAEAL
ncbi:MAG: F0F1 ATP synthase subunit gamma [Rhodospirillaceae bacterium]|jgi:F-type H+-transporting ATPase subunit gamma|nr:F0F1 ATP synthase subunit gamma [Rhodospirillaceae bacterium]